jgi:hypothetical protein
MHWRMKALQTKALTVCGRRKKTRSVAGFIAGR